MIGHRISDWDDAYANGAHIAGAERWPAAWIEPAPRLSRGYAGTLRAPSSTLPMAAGGAAP